MRLLDTQILRFVSIISMVVALFGPATAFAESTQAVQEDWRNEDFAFNSHAMATDANDNIYVVGGTGGHDYLVVKKLSPAGVVLWQRIYDPVERLRGAWIAVDRDGNPVVLASIVYGSYADPVGWVTLKYDTHGNSLWVSTLPGQYSDARRVEVDANNNIYVTGRMWLTNAAGNTTLDSVLIKYSAGGSVLWSATFDNGSAQDEPYSLTISPDGTRIGIGGISGYLFMGLMYDANGNLLWSSTNIAYAAHDVAFGPGNVSYFATGAYSPGAANPYPMALAKFDAAGNLSWVKAYSVGSRALRVRVDGEGNVVAAGIDSTKGYTDWMTIKADSAGNLLWSQRYDGGKNNHEWPEMLAIDAAGAVYVTGTGGPNPGTGTTSYLKGVVARYEPDGTRRWAVWDDFAGGKSIRFLAGNSLASLQWTYFIVSRYSPTGLPDALPNAPTSLQGSTWFTGSSYVVSLSFADNAENEFWVEIERCKGSGCTGFSKIGQTPGEDSTSFMDYAVAAGDVYRYRARAVGFMGASGYSNVVEVTMPTSGTTTSAPAAPSGLAAATSGTEVALSWGDNSTNESLFYIERCGGEGCSGYSEVGSVGSNVTAWKDVNTAAGQSYSYRVRAWNSGGYSGYSNTATITIAAEEPPAEEAPAEEPPAEEPAADEPAAPPAPDSLVAKGISATQISLGWATSASNVDGFKIERCVGNRCTNFTQIATVAATARSHADSGLKANTSYSYRIRAYNELGDSPYSNTATVKTRNK